MKADPKADAAAPKSSPKKLMLIIGLGVLVLALGGGTAFFFTQGKEDGPAKKSVKAEPPEYLQLDAFTVNLQPETGEQYLQIQFTLQVANLQQVELIKTNMPKVRSRVLLLLSGKKASEISTVEGKRQLASEIIASVAQPFVDKGEPQQVKDVLYTSFIIQ
jgi:flagellar FliL protein